MNKYKRTNYTEGLYISSYAHTLTFIPTPYGTVSSFGNKYKHNTQFLIKTFSAMLGLDSDDQVHFQFHYNIHFQKF